MLSTANLRMARGQSYKVMLARHINTPDTFDHLYLGIPALQYHRLKQARTMGALDASLNDFDRGPPTGVHAARSNQEIDLSKPPKF